MKFGSLFTGGGGFDVGAREAGLELAWGVEYIPAIAAWANAQLGEHVRCLDILSADPVDFEPVDYLHASPPCPSFSVANSKGGETDHDIALSAAVARFLAHHRPRYFSLENVYGYRKSQSWAVIREELNRLGYGFSVEHINAADFAVPQKRRRMIVRAVRDTFFHPDPMRPTHAEGGAGGLLPWVGWWEAVADIAHTFPESKLARWQVERLGGEIEGTVLVNTNQSGDEGEAVWTSGGDDPAFTAKPADLGRLRAVLVDNQTDGSKRELITYEADEPANAAKAAGGGRQMRAVLVRAGNPSRFGGVNNLGGDGGLLEYQDEPAPSLRAERAEIPRAILGNDARVVALTPRALARFQTFPDWYALPEKKTLAVALIGNAVPPLLAQRIVESLIP